VQATVTPNATAAPDGTLTADKLVENTATAGHDVRQTVTTEATPVTISCYCKAAERDAVLIGDFNLNLFGIFKLTGFGSVLSASPATSTQIIALSNGWYLCVVTGIAASGARPYGPRLVNAAGSTNYTGDGTSGIYIWGADLRVSNIGVNLPAYQRVNTSTDYDSTGFPVYIKPNGSNQFMQTNSINFTTTDKMTVWQGVRKLSDAAVGIIMELSTSAGGGTSGTFVLHNQTSPVGYRYAAGSGVSGTAFATDDFSVFTAPITNVITGISNFAGATLADEISVRVNGATPTQSLGGTVSSGNFGNFPAFFYMRGGGSLPFNGHDYGSIARGAASTAAQIANGEKYINKLTKAYTP
jgi:hypothetical protein